MNERTLRKLDRLLERLDRQGRRPRRAFPLSAIYLALGLVLGYQLLVRFVMLVWAALLPGGLARTEFLSGPPALVWRLSLFCHDNFEKVLMILGAVGITGLVLARGPWPARLLAWLAAVGVVLADAAIVLVTIKTCLDATLQGSVLP